MDNVLHYIFNKKTIHLFALVLFTLMCSDKFPDVKIGHFLLNNFVFGCVVVTYIIMEIYLQKEYYNIQKYKQKIDIDKRSIKFLQLELFKYKIQTCKNEFSNSQIDTFGVCRKILARISKNHKFTSNERLSIYKVYRKPNRKSINDDVFNIIGRYSPNSDYNDSSRKIYPASIGVIGEAYKNQKHYVENLPNYNTNPQKYKKVIKEKYKMDEGLVEHLNMKSRIYGAYVLRDEDDVSNDIILVFESIQPKTPIMNKDILDDIVELYKKDLLLLIKDIDIQKPALNYAEERGY